MLNLPRLTWIEFLRFWNFLQLPHALWYIGMAVALFVLLLALALRFMRWLEQSNAWLVWLVRLLGNLMFVALGLVAVPACLFGVAVWFGSREADPQYADAISAGFADVLQAALWGAGVGLVLGIAAVFYLTRHVIPRFASMLDRGTRKTRDDELTDVRTVGQLLPEATTYDPRRYYDECRRRHEVFVGLERGKSPLAIALRRARESHVQLVGPTGSGKGVAAQNFLTQAVRRGEAVVVFDPKVDGDKWLPSVLYAECKAAGVPFRFINLCAELPQFNLLKGADAREITQLLTTGLRLGRQGTEADFYRLAERAFAKRAARGEFGPPECLPALADALREAAGEEYDKLRGLLDQVNELADIPAVQTAAGTDLGAVLEQGGVLYIAGSDVDEDVLLLQPMLVLRLVQLIRCRERDTGRQVLMFLDEVKHLLSKPVINSLGLIRDRGCNLILAHQALEDLYCIDADRETTEGAVRVNCTLRLCYRQTDPDTVQWIEAQTGTIVVNAESREIARNAALSEVQHETRRLQQIQRAKIDANMIQQLPEGCGVLIGAGVARLVFTAPQMVPRLKFTPGAAPKYERRSTDLLRHEDQPAPSAHATDSL
ncbi:MAG TPA: type IV secretion system DNA-binding domain-containing protein [Edaphobacter sp.]|uniref:type IV secretory system conjugative DNA transfer family protein n=1 Tax=Edaphobacter sp. TaxID=1934404 RepID=UPI002C86A8C6|nr:type IV secretion system DNA-binding domain-containing protein [Edaphobacter sp.]HUZ94418.1 type IV secretion system DNA-binding domain-containing protein [Edaphobacter sp.]